MATDSPVSVEKLLAHSQWLRRLALGLVGDVHAADDLVQATWQAALEAQPRHAGNLRGWLQRTVRRIAAAQRRGRDRRSRREQIVGSRSTDPAAQELVEQADLQRHLVALVTQLPEPGRSTILLHFFGGMSPSAIARRQGIPASTVRNRLKRALDALRRQLDEEHRGNRRQWQLMLVPLAVGRRVRLAGATSPWLAVVAAVALAATVGWLAWPAGDAADGRSEVARAAASDVTPGTVGREDFAEHTATRSAPAPTREPVSASPTESDADHASAEAATATTAWGMVVDDRGRPVSGAVVGFRPLDAQVTRALAETDGDGVFRWRASEEPGRLEVPSEHWTTVLFARHDRSSRGVPAAIVVAPRAAVTGRVTDPTGRAVAGATVRLSLPEGLRARVGVLLETAEENGWETTADEAGQFAFADAPRLPELRATCRAVGHAEWSGAVATPLSITLTPFGSADAASIRGRVVDPEGAAVAGAKVSLAGRDTWTASDGSFELGTDSPLPSSARLVAIKEGLGLAVSTDVDLLSAFVTLHFGQQAVYAGRLRTSEGDPVAGATVQLTPTPSAIGVDAATPRLSPAAMSGRLSVGPALRLSSVETDDAGAFRIVAPEFDAWQLTAVDLGTLRRASLGGTDEREGLEIVFPPDRLRSLEGTVVDQWGRPFPDVRLSAQRALHSALTSGAMISLGNRHTTSDSNGRFLFEDLTATQVRLFAIAPGAMPTWTTVEASTSDVTLRVVVTGHVRVVTLLDADAVGFLDGEGEPMPIVTCEGRFLRTGSRQVPLFDGRTGVHRVPLDAASIAIYRQSEEIRRLPISILPDRLNVVRP